MSEIDSVVNLIGKKLQKQSTDRQMQTIDNLLKKYDCLHLRNDFIDSVQKHSPVRSKRASFRDSVSFNDSHT